MPRLRDTTLDLEEVDFEEALAFIERLHAPPQRSTEPASVARSTYWRRPATTRIDAKRSRLSGANPWWMEIDSADDLEPAPPAALGRLLFDAVSVSRVRWQTAGSMFNSPERPWLHWPKNILDGRRPVPSGGAMYPAEVYIATVHASEPTGVFRYDPARHELIHLDHPDPISSLQELLVSNSML